jgi:protein-tyrosine phosphatase
VFNLPRQRKRLSLLHLLADDTIGSVIHRCLVTTGATISFIEVGDHDYPGRAIVTDFGFGPACENEQIVFGAQRPGFAPASVKDWISYMKAQGIKRVCCLLSEGELRVYQENLLSTYSNEFGRDNVNSAPVEDLHLISPVLLKKVLGFLKESDESQRPVVAHCAGGLGRTGHVLSAWLVSGRGVSVAEALSAVKNTGREPCQAVIYGNATKKQLHDLLKSC